MRLFVTALLISFVTGLIVLVIGLLLKWQTSTQFSNGLFWAGILVIVFGILSVMGGYGMRSDFKVLYSQSAGNMNLGDRSRRWVADVTQGYNTLIFSVISGGILIGLAILIGGIF